MTTTINIPVLRTLVSELTTRDAKEEEFGSVTLKQQGVYLTLTLGRNGHAETLVRVLSYEQVGQLTVYGAQHFVRDMRHELLADTFDEEDEES